MALYEQFSCSACAQFKHECLLCFREGALDSLILDYGDALLRRLTPPLQTHTVKHIGKSVSRCL